MSKHTFPTSVPAGMPRQFGKELSNYSYFSKPKSPFATMDDGQKSVPKKPTLHSPSFEEIMEFRPKSQPSVTKMELEDHLDPWDLEENNNPQFVTGYCKDIFKYLKTNEDLYSAKHGYLNSQPEINEKMRAILLDWLVDVQVKFKLLPETLFMAVNLIDRYCQLIKMTRTKYQLLGITSLFIAAKYEEIYPPELKEFVYVTDNAYTKTDVLEMEGQIISTLDFNLLSISPLRFLERHSRIAKLDNKFTYFAKYLIELALIDYSMLRYSPSLLACASIFLSNRLANRAEANELVLGVSGYKETQIKPLVYEIITLLQASEKSSLQAVRRKYASPAYYEVSRIRINLMDKRPQSGQH